MSDLSDSHDTVVWVSRHAEAHNPRNILYGRLPRVGLSATGRDQARSLGRFFAERPIAAVYSSPLLRARQTATLIREALGQEAHRIDRDLLEVKTRWQGAHNDDLEAIDWDFYAHRHPDDDTMESIRDRMRAWFDRMVRRHAGDEVVGVSHGDPILILVADLLGKPLTRQHVVPVPYIDTATVYRVAVDSRGRVADIQSVVPHRDPRWA
jgi:probable phosphoglycerate mutase